MTMMYAGEGGQSFSKRPFTSQAPASRYLKKTGRIGELLIFLIAYEQFRPTLGASRRTKAFLPPVRVEFAHPLQGVLYGYCRPSIWYGFSP